MVTSAPVSPVLSLPEVSVPGWHQALVHLVAVVAEQLLPRLHVAAAEDPHDLSPPRVLHAPVAAVGPEAVVDLVPKACSVDVGVSSDLQGQVYVVSVIAFNHDFVHVIKNLLLLKSFVLLFYYLAFSNNVLIPRQKHAVPGYNHSSHKEH